MRNNCRFTIIVAPSSTKNKEKKRNLQAHSVKKGKHGTMVIKHMSESTAKRELVHTVKTTAANVHDVIVMPDLLTGEKTYVYGDGGYIGVDKLENAVIKNKCGKKTEYKINRQPSQMRKLSKDKQYKAKK